MITLAGFLVILSTYCATVPDIPYAIIMIPGQPGLPYFDLEPIKATDSCGRFLRRMASLCRYIVSLRVHLGI